MAANIRADSRSGNPYQNGQQTYSSYNPYGNVPLDKKGQPLKNRFGMKLTIQYS